MPLERPALSRSTHERWADRRIRPGLVEEALADPGTRVLVLAGDLAAVPDDASPGGAALPTLTRHSPADLALLGPPRLLAYLGRSAEEAEVLLAVVEAEPDLTGVRWAGLRDLGALLDDGDAGLLTTGVALSNWHLAHPRCSRCGEATEVVQAGWARRCPACAAEHYPRTDPAVIMTVVDDDDRLLLGRQEVWPEKRFSALAGFVEPGESLEAAVRREVAEEAGVRVGDVEYLGSQPWPFPCSLMVGFRARALSTDIVVDVTELAEAHWWSRERFTADVASGELMLPPSVSIARRLIEHWYGEPVPAEGTWR